MSIATILGTPKAVAIRVFGTTVFLLAAMLVVLHPGAMMAAMHNMAWSGWQNILG